MPAISANEWRRSMIVVSKLPELLRRVKELEGEVRTLREELDEKNQG